MSKSLLKVSSGLPELMNKSMSELQKRLKKKIRQYNISYFFLSNWQWKLSINLTIEIA